MQKPQWAACAAWILASCGGEAIGPVEVRLPGDVPCARWPSQLDLVAEPEDIAIQAFRQMAEFNLSFAMQEALLLTQPIRDDPKAQSWKLDEGGVRIEGAVLAGGEDWSVVKMVAFAGVASFDVDIDVIPGQTTYEFGDRTLVVRPYLVRTEQLTYGCDPEAGISFERLRAIDGDGELKQIDRCFRDPVRQTQALTAGGPAQPTEPGSYQEGTLAIPGSRPLGLECRQIISRAELGF